MIERSRSIDKEVPYEEVCNTVVAGAWAEHVGLGYSDRDGLHQYLPGHGPAVVLESVPRAISNSMPKSVSTPLPNPKPLPGYLPTTQP
jgi:hypothetical protein